MLKSDEVHVGDEAPVKTHTLTRTDLVRYAGASGDFNPMHTDEVAAKAAGLPSVFGHGMFSMGLLGTALTDYVGVGNLKTYKVRFTKQTWPDEELRTRIVVTGTREVEGQRLIDLECSLANADGEVKVAGEAVAVAG
jgi:acyl dehydratase